MRDTHLAWLAVGLLWTGALLHAQDACDCSHPESTSKFLHGGDGHPLKWSSSSGLLVGGPGASPTYCYERTVQNYDAREVRDILWPIAGYSRRFLPPRPNLGKPNCCCDAISIVGGVAPTPPKGPLFFGPSGMYATSVWSPESGWSTAKAQVYELARTHRGVPLTSGIQFAVKRRAGVFTISNVRVTSRTETIPDAGVNYFYELSNMGEESVFLRFALPEAGDFWRQVEFGPNTQISLTPGDKVQKHVISKLRITLAYIPVSITDGKQEFLARGLVAMYFPRK